MTKLSMTKTIRQDLLEFRWQRGLNLDEEHRLIWMAQLGSFIFPLPNFKWRREVINQHDAHHLLTGYSTSPKGELALASWELGARCFKDWRARALCRLLAFFGLVTQPWLTVSAFQKGRAQAAEYERLIQQDFLDMPAELAKAILTGQSPLKIKYGLSVV